MRGRAPLCRRQKRRLFCPAALVQLEKQSIAAPEVGSAPRFERRYYPAVLCVIEIVGHAVRPRIEGYCAVLRIGIVSDTHGLLRPEAEQGLVGGRISSTLAILVARTFSPDSVGLHLSLRSEERSILATGRKVIPALRWYGSASDLSMSCTTFRNCRSIQQFAELTWSFPATRIDRGSKRLTVCSI
jgi:hypothetical protein